MRDPLAITVTIWTLYFHFFWQSIGVSSNYLPEYEKFVGQPRGFSKENEVAQVLLQIIEAAALVTQGDDYYLDWSSILQEIPEIDLHPHLNAEELAWLLPAVELSADGQSLHIDFASLLQTLDNQLEDDMKKKGQDGQEPEFVHMSGNSSQSYGGPSEETFLRVGLKTDSPDQEVHTALQGLNRSEAQGTSEGSDSEVLGRRLQQESSQRHTLTQSEGSSETQPKTEASKCDPHGKRLQQDSMQACERAQAGMGYGGQLLTDIRGSHMPGHMPQRDSTQAQTTSPSEGGRETQSMAEATRNELPVRKLQHESTQGYEHSLSEESIETRLKTEAIGSEQHGRGLLQSSVQGPKLAQPGNGNGSGGKPPADPLFQAFMDRVAGVHKLLYDGEVSAHAAVLKWRANVESKVANWQLSHPVVPQKAVNRLEQLGQTLGQLLRTDGTCMPYLYIPAGIQMPAQILGPAYYLTATTGNCILLPQINGLADPSWSNVVDRMGCQGGTGQYLLMPATVRGQGPGAEAFLCPQCPLVRRFGAAFSIRLWGGQQTVRYDSIADFFLELARSSSPRGLWLEGFEHSLGEARAMLLEHGGLLGTLLGGDHQAIGTLQQVLEKAMGQVSISGSEGAVRNLTAALSYHLSGNLYAGRDTKKLDPKQRSSRRAHDSDQKSDGINNDNSNLGTGHHHWFGRNAGQDAWTKVVQQGSIASFLGAYENPNPEGWASSLPSWYDLNQGYAYSSFISDPVSNVITQQQQQRQQ